MINYIKFTYLSLFSKIDCSLIYTSISAADSSFSTVMINVITELSELYNSAKVGRFLTT